MAVNEVFKLGEYISIPVPTGLKSGDAVRVGSLNAVLTTDEGGGVGNRPGYASVDLSGAHKFILPGAEVGDPVYITSANALTLTAAGNDLFGAVTHLDPRVADRVVVLTHSITV